MSEEQKDAVASGPERKQWWWRALSLLVLLIGNMLLMAGLDYSHRQIREMSGQVEQLKKAVNKNCRTSAQFGYTCGVAGVSAEDFVADCDRIFDPTNGMINDISIHLTLRARPTADTAMTNEAPKMPRHRL